MLEETFKAIKDAKLDIELLRRDNEKKCMENNIKIDELEAIIGHAEEGLEVTLKESGEKKLECKLGWCAYWVMPDSWEYMDSEIIDWCKHEGLPYYHTVEILEKMKLKEAIKLGKFRVEEVIGLIVTPQEPKFNYKLNGGL